MTTPRVVYGFEVDNTVVGSTKITIPSQKKGNELVRLSAWLLFWLLILTWLLAIGYQVILGISQEKSFNCFAPLIGIPLTLGMLVWGTRGAMGAHAFLWRIAGLETIEASYTVLKIRRTIFGIGRTREYEGDKINNISLGSPVMMHFAFLRFKSTQFELPISGPILVNVTNRGKAGVEHLGLGLGQDQAQMIIDILRQQIFPDKAPVIR